MLDNQKIEKKIWEVLGLEMAAQKAVEQIISQGILDKADIKKGVQEIREEANNNQTQLEELCQKLSESEGLNEDNY